jgi:hypothetical protein
MKYRMTADEFLKAFPDQATEVSRTNLSALYGPSGAVPDPAKRPKPAEMAPFVYLEPATWVIPVRLESEMNRRGSVKGQSARNRTVKNAVYRALGPYWKVWGPVGDRVRADLPCVIRAIRLGGTGLDTGGLWASMKFPEDAVANLLGCDDGWPAWKRAFQVYQEPGRLWGLRIELQTPPLTRTDGKEQ